MKISKIVRFVMLVLCFGAGIFFQGQSSLAADYKDPREVWSVGRNNVFQGDVTVGVQIAVDGAIHRYVYDDFVSKGSTWNYDHTVISCEGGWYSAKSGAYVTNTEDDNAFVWAMPQSSDYRIQVRIKKLKEALGDEDYSVVIYEVNGNYENDSRVEYSFMKPKPLEAKKDSIFQEKDSINLDINNGSSSYYYNIYYARELNESTSVSVDTNGGRLVNGGKACYTEKGYYIKELPVAYCVTPGYENEFLGWFDAEGTEVVAGQEYPNGTVMTAKWKKTPINYNVECIDILGNDVETGVILGKNVFQSPYETIASGEQAGNDSRDSVYYQGCCYSGCTETTVQADNNTVYRFFRASEYPVKYMDVVEGGEKNGTVLHTTEREILYGTKISGSELGEDTSLGAYYPGYLYDYSTSATVTTNGVVVYRYFRPHQYTIIFDGNDAISGSMNEIAGCRTGETVTLMKNCFQKENIVSLDLNSKNATCDTSEVVVKRKFLGWSLEKNGSVRYSDGDTITNATLTEDQLTLYAVWSDEKTDITAIPKKMGYDFAGWSRQNDSETGATQFSITEDTTIYAVWNPCIVKYHVEYYKENVDGIFELSSSYEFEGYTDETVEIKRNDTLFQGYNLDKASSVLSGNVKADGSLILSAFYYRNRYQLTYDLNGGVCQEENIAVKEEQRYGQEIQIVSWDVTREGYRFLGWSQSPRGGQTLYQPGDTMKMQNHDVVLYAVWTSNVYQTVFDSNGGNTDCEMKNVTFTGADGEKLPACTLKKTGYHFKGWNTKKDGSGTAYEDRQDMSEIYPEEGNVLTLYAQWEPISFSIEYRANVPKDMEQNVKGKVDSTVFTYEQDSFVSDDTYDLPGYRFIGWNTKADGNGIMLQPGENLKNYMLSEENQIFYGIWKANTNTEFTLLLYFGEETDPSKTLTCYGTTGETAESALRKLYEKELKGEDGKYFYSGYEMTNPEDLAQKIQGDHSTKIHCRMKERTYSLTFHYGDGKENELLTENSQYQEKLTLPSQIIVQGKNLDVMQYVDEEGNVYEPGNTVSMERNLELYPQHKLTLYSNAEGISDSIEYITYGKEYRLPELKRNGYEFKGWYKENGEFAGQANEIIGNTDYLTNLRAKWSDPLVYHITYDIEDASVCIIENKVLTYTFGEEILLPTASQLALDDSYEFVGWYNANDPDKKIIERILPDTYGDVVLKASLKKKTGEKREDESSSTKTDDTSSSTGNQNGDIAGGEDTNGNNGREDVDNGNAGEEKSDNLSNKKVNSPENSLDTEILKKGDSFWYKNIKYRVINDKKGKEMVQIVGNRYKKSSLVLTNTITRNKVRYQINSIGKKSFYGNKTIRKIVIGNSVKKIETSAFSQMKKLNYITIGKGVTSIGKNALGKNKSLKKIIVLSKKIAGKNLIKAYSGKKGCKIYVQKNLKKAYQKKYTKMGVRVLVKS